MGATIAAILLFGYGALEQIAYHAKLAFYEYQCIHFNPPTWVAIRSNTLAPAGPAIPPFIQIAGHGGDQFPQRLVRYEQLRGNTQIIWCNQPLPIFCHERSTPDGQRRLVVVILSGNMSMDGCANIDIDLVQPGVFGGQQISTIHGSFGPSRHIGSYVVETLLLATHIYMGQIDPSDSTHFTIDYDDGQKRGTIDGWLESGSSVRLSARPGPIDVEAYWKDMEANE